MVGKVERHLKVVGGTDSGSGGPPAQACIEALEEALEMARSGYIHTVFLVGQCYDRSIISGWSESPPGVHSSFELLGGIEAAKSDYIALEIDQRQR